MLRAWGGYIRHSRSAVGEIGLSRASAYNLTQKWKVPTGTYGDVTNVPSVYRGVVYFGDFQGYMWAVSQETGAVIWKVSLAAITGIIVTDTGRGDPALPAVIISRTTPAVAADYSLLLVDTSVNAAIGPAAYVLALNLTSGALVPPHCGDHHDGGTVYRSNYYIGVASLVTLALVRCHVADAQPLPRGVFAADPSYPCCTFIGSALAIDIPTGNILCKKYMLPENGGRNGSYSGAALWGGSPSIDQKRNTVFFASGNLYSVPSRVAACQEANGSDFPDPCVKYGNYAEAVVALDLESGRVVWATRLNYIDAWNMACGSAFHPTPGNPNCPPQPGPDADFGMAPIFLKGVKLSNMERRMDLLIRHRRNQVGPGGPYGRISWGMATAGKRVYAFVANSLKMNFALEPGSTVTTGGGFVALDSIANPTGVVPVPSLPPLVANGVAVFATGDGVLVVVNSATGAILKTIDTGYSIYGGTSVDKGCIFVGNGNQRGAQVLGTTSGTNTQKSSRTYIPGISGIFSAAQRVFLP
eukprot:jgi/Mesen1/773/ME000110S_11039